jgi:O-antigen ligase
MENGNPVGKPARFGGSPSRIAPLARLPAQRLRLWVYVTMLLICFAGGGGARDDIASLLFVRPAAVVCAALILLLPGKIELKSVRVPLAVCLAFAAWMAIQLIPLPPEVWRSLPGREMFAEPMRLVGLPQPWRPISISPDLTLNSLAAMVVPIAALIGSAALTREQRFSLLPVLIGAVLVSVLLGVAQLAGGESSPFYLYRITNRDSAVGLFANRNHGAALLAAAFPMLATWAALKAKAADAAGWRIVFAAAAGIVLIPMVLVTGSRAGLLFGGVAAAGAWLLYLQRPAASTRGLRGWTMAVLGIGAIAAGGLIFSFAAFDRAESLQRLLQDNPSGGLRLETVGLVTNLAKEGFPLGFGFGTFDPLYRIHEPLEYLTPFYLNHAHDDLLELAITGGAPALALLLVGITWILISARRVFMTWRAPSAEVGFARLGLVIMVLWLAWSLVDYPLRTPSLAMVFAIASSWLGAAGARVSKSAEPTAVGGAA